MAPVIPAQPGTRILQLLEDDAHVSVCASPVVAWYADEVGVVPVTARGRHDGIDDGDYVVEFPSGEIIAHGAGSWVSRDEWLAGLLGGDDRQLPLDLAA